MAGEKRTATEADATEADTTGSHSSPSPPNVANDPTDNDSLSLPHQVKLVVLTGDAIIDPRRALLSAIRKLSHLSRQALPSDKQILQAFAKGPRYLDEVLHQLGFNPARQPLRERMPSNTGTAGATAPNVSIYEGLGHSHIDDATKNLPTVRLFMDLMSQEVFPFYPGVKRLLARLKKHNIRVMILADHQKVISKRLQEDKVPQDHVDLIMSFLTGGFANPRAFYNEFADLIVPSFGLSPLLPWPKTTTAAMIRNRSFPDPISSVTVWTATTGPSGNGGDRRGNPDRNQNDEGDSVNSNGKDPQENIDTNTKDAKDDSATKPEAAGSLPNEKGDANKEPQPRHQAPTGPTTADEDVVMTDAGQSTGSNKAPVEDKKELQSFSAMAGATSHRSLADKSPKAGRSTGNKPTPLDLSTSRPQTPTGNRLNSPHTPVQSPGHLEALSQTPQTPVRSQPGLGNSRFVHEETTPTRSSRGRSFLDAQIGQSAARVRPNTRPNTSTIPVRRVHPVPPPREILLVSSTPRVLQVLGGVLNAKTVLIPNSDPDVLPRQPGEAIPQPEDDGYLVLPDIEELGNYLFGDEDIIPMDLDSDTPAVSAPMAPPPARRPILTPVGPSSSGISRDNGKAKDDSATGTNDNAKAKDDKGKSDDVKGKGKAKEVINIDDDSDNEMDIDDAEPSEKN